MTATAIKVTAEQLTRIRELSKIVLGDPDRLFLHVGIPETRWEASTMLGALHKIRNQHKPAAGQEAAMTERIQQIPHASTVQLVDPLPQEEEKSELMPETKRCKDCDEVKPASQFGADRRTADGLARHCKDCKRVLNRKYNANRKQRSTAPSRSPIPAPTSASTQETPPLPVQDDWRQAFVNPTLDRLRLLQAFLDSSLDTAAEVCGKVTDDVA